MLEKDLKITRSKFLEGKTSLTDEDIINLLDLPPEKESRKDLKSYTDKNYSDFENDDASLQRLTENLINNSDYLLYRGSYIAKSKLLYEQSVTLCNEIPTLVIGQEIKESFYLLPYGYAKDSKQNFKQFADILDKTVFTDIKRIYGESLRNNFKKAHKQGKNVFFFICNDKLDSKECENEIKKCVYNRKEIKDKSAKYYFYIEKSKQCLIFDFDSKGKLLKKKKLNIDLKKIKLSTNEELKVVRGRMQSIPSGTLKNLSDNKESVNTFFNSLLLRGEVEMIRRHKELQKYDLKYLNCLEALKQITNQTQSELLQNSNRLFIQSEIESEFYKDLIKEKKRNVALIDKTQGDKSMPSEKKELNISEEEAVRIQLAREIRQNMPNLSDGERAAALAILEAGAASMKMTLREFQTRTTEQKERKKIEVQTYKFQNGETIDEILSKQTSWATDEEFLDNMIDNSLREVADFADEKENELLKKISIAKNNPEVDLKLLAVQTDAAARYMAAKHYDYRLADVGNRPFSKDFINLYAQDDFPYELPSWIKNHLEEYPNQNEPEHTSEEEKAYQEWEEMLEDNQREENIISHNVLKTKDSEKNISNTQREENSYLNSEELKSSLKKALNEIAKPLEVIPFTRENYNLLFPHSHIISPIENVKLGEHQFEKLDIKERQHILKAVHDTVATPDIIINEKRKTVFDDEKEAHVYAKAFKIDGKNKAVQSVVVSIEDENVSISTHLREINNVVNKIKMPEQLIFASTEIGQMVERLTGKQLGTVNPTRENEIFAPPVTTIPQNTENSINYHGLTLTKKDNNLIEPAYDVLLISGIDDKTDSKLIEMLDNTAKWDQYCVLNKSENYIPAIAAEIVEKEKEIKNENVNKSFIQKVQDLKAKVSKSLKKNVAVGVALTSVLSANPNLFAQEKPVKLPSEQTILKEAAKEKENLLKIYKDKSPEELLKLLLEANEEKTAAKIQASNLENTVKELEVKNTKLENTVKELEVKNTKLEFYKEHYKTKSATQESFYDEMKKTQDMYESLKRSSQQDHDILYKHAKIVVNGQERVCHTGLVDGFKNCVTRLDKNLKLNKELVKENNELRKIINQSNQNERNGVSY